MAAAGAIFTRTDAGEVKGRDLFGSAFFIMRTDARPNWREHRARGAGRDRLGPSAPPSAWLGAWAGPLPAARRPGLLHIEPMGPGNLNAGRREPHRRLDRRTGG